MFDTLWCYGQSPITIFNRQCFFTTRTIFKNAMFSAIRGYVESASISNNGWTQYCPFGENRGSVWYTIYDHLPVVTRGKQTPLLVNQPMGKGHLWMNHVWFKHVFDLDKVSSVELDLTAKPMSQPSLVPLSIDGTPKQRWENDCVWCASESLIQKIGKLNNLHAHVRWLLISA